MGATVLAEPGHGLSVTGMAACRIASAAAAHYIPIQELTPRSVLAPVSPAYRGHPGLQHCKNAATALAATGAQPTVT
jgi:hypothetical protein